MAGPFRRVLVDHLVRGRTQVTWELEPPFCDPDPWEVKLQWGHTGDPGADDWADVADFAPAAGVLTDPTPRDDAGTAPRVHYRVVLRTPRGVYTSAPASALDRLDRKHWLRAQALARKERLRFLLIDATAGWLFKRRREGPTPDVTQPRQAVVSFLSGEIVNSRSPATVGTEYSGGYYAPVPFWVDFSLGGTREERDGAKARGTVDDKAVRQRGRVLLDPPLAEGDVFVAAGSDERFVVHDVDYTAQVGRLPLLADATFGLAPRSDVVYSLPVPDVAPFPAEVYCG